MEFDHSACYRALLARDARFDGLFFVAVRSTGIYCRPICPARTPKPENCLFLSSAAAAQAAGYRSCLRCRPERSPELDPWRGRHGVVSRALALIEGGALDAGSIETLATRVGVGARQLRRLFREHLGAAPVTVVQTRRVLLAQRLLRETALPMVDVALASGFGSVRRFNETFRALYGCTPGSLRRRSARVSATAGSAITINLPYRPPYAWDAMLGFLRARAIPGVEAVTTEAYRRVIEIDGTCGLLEVAHDARAGVLRATIRHARLAHLPGIIARLRRMFDLAADPTVIAAALMRDPLLAAAVQMRPGLRVPGAWSGFEVAVRAILGQQITVVAATRLAARLVAAFGTSVDAAGAVDGELSRCFPAPSALVEADIAGIGMPRARAEAIRALARATIAEPALFEPGPALDAAILALRALPGIGEWTAQYIAMRVLRESDAFPAADVGLLRAVTVPGTTRPQPAALLARAEAWRPWRAYAALHLWTADAVTGAASGSSRTALGKEARHAARSVT